MPAEQPLSRSDPKAASDAQRLAGLLQQVERGQPVNHCELVELAESGDWATRGLAKRLLAHLLVRRAQQDAADLLQAACGDLEFRYPVVLQEAIEHAHTLGQFDRIYDLWLCAGELAAARDEHLPAAIALMNGCALDFRQGARHLDDPACIRRTVNAYERVAAGAASLLGVRPAEPGRRRSDAGGRLRLAHVTPQLVDGGHAPSRVMRTVLRHADRERYNTYLFVTESFAPYDQRPLQTFASDWSDRRAPELIRYLTQELTITVVFPRTRQNLLQAAADLHRAMAGLKIDIAYHHGSIATPADWLLCAWQGAPWQVAYGMGVPLHCPHVDYQFFEYAESMEDLAFLCREHGIPYGTSDYGGTDLSYLDEVEPFTREQLRVPPDHVILGTVGNHLTTRMSERFCRTVADVLRYCPNTTYLIVGPGDFSRQAAAFGNDLCAGAAPRIRFVGSSSEPGRWTRTFDIYVNQYPAGGGISLCEAMAARVPVLGMCVDDSNLAAAGLKLLGAENVVQPTTDEAYAARLVQLINEPSERERLGAALRQRYESDFDGRRWANDITDRIYSLVQESLEGSKQEAVAVT